MGSTRLPGKILMPVLGKPLLQWELERVSRCKEVDGVVLATTTLAADDPVAELAKTLGVFTFRGSSENVLERYYQAAVKHQADLIVRITGDCPLIDPAVIDRVIQAFKAGNFDYVSNTAKRTYPRGMDVEVFSFKVLLEAYREAKRSYEIEHVTPFIYQRPERYRLANVTLDPPHGDLRWTVDTIEDFTLIEKILQQIGKKAPQFILEDLLNLMNTHPEWKQINAHIQQKPLSADR
jgi:spore coat polysaccharide biosynthesis protein SpsF